MALPTNYKDDVFTGKRKYRMTTNPDTTVSFDDETEYTQQGDTYGAAQINAANDKINDLDDHAYRDSDTAETTLADNDYIPFYDASAGAKRKALFSSVKSFLLGAFAPKSHPSNSASTYGAGNASQFGHVRVSDNYTQSDGTASQSVCASSQAVHNAYANRAPVNHASADTTYGRGSNSAYGHVKLSDTYTSNPGAASEGMAASGKAVHDAYAAGQNNYNSLNNSKAPNNHKSSETTYGVGSSTEFGHLKISDNVSQSAGAAADGVAASSKAVATCYRDKAPTTHSSPTAAYGIGARSQYGHLKITDGAYEGNAAAGMAASSDLVGVVNDKVDNNYNDLKGELTANGNRIYMDYKNGEYGYNTSANRGADTFHPFKHTAVMELIGSGTAPNDSSTSGTLLTTSKKFDYLVCFGIGVGGATRPYGSWNFTTNSGTTVVDEGGYYDDASFAIFQGVNSGATIGFSSDPYQDAPVRTYQIYGVTT